MAGLALLSALLLTQAAPATSPPDDEVVVEGARQQRDRVRTFVRALADVRGFGQIGRFHMPVCPAAMGLPDAQNRMVAERMKRVAQAAGIRVGDAKCKPNMFLIAAVDKGSAVSTLYKRYPAYFTDMGRGDVRKLIDSSERAVAWQIQGRLSSDGQLLKKLGHFGYYVNESTDGGSRIRSGTVPHFVASMVVVEREALNGLSVTQVADYAAMRGLAATKPKRAAEAGAPTILTILDAADDQQVPLSLTQWDFGYLKSLYATSNAYYAGYQRGDMAHELEKELTKGEGKRR